MLYVIYIYVGGVLVGLLWKWFMKDIICFDLWIILIFYLFYSIVMFCNRDYDFLMWDWNLLRKIGYVKFNLVLYISIIFVRFVNELYE